MNIKEIQKNVKNYLPEKDTNFVQELTEYYVNGIPYISGEKNEWSCRFQFDNKKTEQIYRKIIDDINNCNNDMYLQEISLAQDKDKYKYEIDLQFYKDYITWKISWYGSIVLRNFNNISNVKYEDSNKLSFSHLRYYNAKKIIFLYFPEKNILYIKRNNQHKFYPLTLKSLSQALGEIPLDIIKYFSDILLKPILENCKSKLLFKDIKEELLSGTCIVPIKVEDLFNKELKSKKMLFNNCYKLSFEMPKSVNKRSLNDTYVKKYIIPKIQENERQKIWNWNLSNEYIFDLFNHWSRKSFGIHLYVDYLIQTNNLAKSKEKNIDLALDLITDMAIMSSKVDKYFNLKIKSANGIIKKHNQLIPRYIALTEKGKLTFPKKNKFEKLKLPEQYELIKTAKRLKEEGIMQNHCVYSYLDLINQGKCVIYSILYEGKRFTLEITAKKKGRKYIYHLAQIQGYGNIAPVPQKLIEETNKLLEAV